MERSSDFALISPSHGQVDIKKSENKRLTRSSKLEHLSHSQNKNVNRLNSCQNGRGTSGSHEWPCIHKSTLCVYYNRVLSHSTDNVLYAGHSVCVCAHLTPAGGGAFDTKLLLMRKLSVRQRCRCNKCDKTCRLFDRIWGGGGWEGGVPKFYLIFSGCRACTH